MPNLGVPELLIILVIVAMLFGVGKLPQVFGAVGKGIREFRKESSDVDAAVSDLKSPVTAVTPPAAQPTAPVAPVITTAAGAPILPPAPATTAADLPPAQPATTADPSK